MTQQDGELVKHDSRVESDVRVRLDRVSFDDAVPDVKK